MTRLGIIVKGCGLRTLAEIDATKFAEWLETYAAIEELSECTRNYYRLHLKSLVSWARKSGRIPRDPLASMVATQTVVNRTNNRRALSAEEVASLLKATRERDCVAT